MTAKPEFYVPIPLGSKPCGRQLGSPSFNTQPNIHTPSSRGDALSEFLPCDPVNFAP